MRAGRRRACGRRALYGAALTILLAPPALAQGTATEAVEPSRSRPAPRTSYADAVAEASRRFAIPERWIRAVMRAESGCDPAAVSPAGAMGLMQIMPATWAMLAARHPLGDDPFDPHANILAGAAYLREMRDIFGWPGALAAYNAGSARYADYLRGLRPLPTETYAYVARVTAALGDDEAARELGQTHVAQHWTRAALFVARPSGVHAASGVNEAPQHDGDALDAHDERLAGAPSLHDATHGDPITPVVPAPADALFVPSSVKLRRARRAAPFVKPESLASVLAPVLVSAPSERRSISGRALG